MIHKYRIPTLVALGLVALLVTLSFTVIRPTHAASAHTGQGIMVNLQASGTFSIVNNQLYKFNPDEAATYYTNAWDGSAPTVSCTGPGCGTAPTAPAAPSPSASQLSHFLTQQICQCAFLDGTSLPSTTYTQTATVSTGSGKTGATYTYTYTYDITPTVSSAAPLTAWDLVQSTGGTSTEIDINAQIAGESVVQNKTVGTKYSFSLYESDGTSRVQNLAVTVTDASNTVVASATPGSTIVQNAPGALPGDPGAVDFTYTTNAGSNGVTSLLENGDARTILNTDSFAGNDNGGADGSALAIANMDPVPLNVGPGDYTVTLTGTVKGNNALADLSFTVTQTIHIIAPGCSGSSSQFP
jgi:hypothetical protein